MHKHYIRYILRWSWREPNAFGTFETISQLLIVEQGKTAQLILPRRKSMREASTLRARAKAILKKCTTFDRGGSLQAMVLGPGNMRPAENSQLLRWRCEVAL